MKHSWILSIVWVLVVGFFTAVSCSVIAQEKPVTAAQAIAEIDYPKMVHGVPSPYPNTTPLIYKWTTIFREKGGKLGYKIHSYGTHVRDPQGGEWVNSGWQKSMVIKPGGTAKFDRWLAKDERWAGGIYHVHWRGWDELGNEINIIQKIDLAR